MEQKEHWEHVYSANESDQVSWFEPESKISLELIRKFLPSADSAILDVGAGASTLVDGLLAAGYNHVAVMDLSGAALRQAQSRLGQAADSVKWIEADVLEATLPAHGIDLWIVCAAMSQSVLLDLRRHPTSSANFETSGGESLTGWPDAAATT